MTNPTLQLGGGNFAVKDGKLLGYATDPKTSVFVSREFDFSRGSNLAATRVDANGLIEKGRENLLTYSNTFDNVVWNSNVNGLTRTPSSIIDPDGGTNAWEITTTATNEHHRLGHNITSGQVKTFSFYAKANGYEYVRFWAFSGGNTGPNYFHLSGAGTAVANGQLGIAFIESVGNGWYRCQGVLDPLNSGAVVIGPAPDASTSGGTSTYLADGTSGIYLYNAQLEAGLVATDYIETGATTAQAGILEDMPRIDYTNSSSPALLLEPQRTNLSIQSEYITGSGAPFSIQSAGMTISYNQTTSPEGVDNAMKWTEASNNGLHWGGLVLTGTSVGDDLTISIFAKRGTSDDRDIIINIYDGATSDRARYNLEAGTIITDSAASNQPVVSMEDYGNGWWRCIYTRNLTNAGYNAVVGLVDGTQPSWQGNGTSNIYTYGLQYEIGSYPTSYIPTYGTAVTRSAPSLSKYDFTDSSTQTLFLEYDDTGYGSGGGELVIEKASPVAAIFRIYVHVSSLANDSVKVRFRTEFPISEFNYDTNRSRSQNQKVAFVISGTTAKAFCNGSLLNTFTITETIMERLNFRVQNVKFRTKQLIMIPTALTDQEAIDLTTL